MKTKILYLALHVAIAYGLCCWGIWRLWRNLRRSRRVPFGDWCISGAAYVLAFGVVWHAISRAFR